MFEIVCLTICWLCFSPPSSRLHQKVAMRQMIWRHETLPMFPPSSLMMMFLFPNSWGIDFQGYLFEKSCRSWLQRLCLKTQSASRLTLHWVQVPFFGQLCFSLWVACAVDGHWWSLIGVDGLRLLRFLFMVEDLWASPYYGIFGAKIDHCSATIPLGSLCAWLFLHVLAISVSDWLAKNKLRSLHQEDSQEDTQSCCVCFRCSCVAVFVCVCVRACLKIFQQPWDATRKYTNQN